jgi:hypothetical protein
VKEVIEIEVHNESTRNLSNRIDKAIQWLDSHNQQLLGCFIAFGVALRLRLYFAQRALWFDEASVANQILSRDWTHLFELTGSDQRAPVGYLWWCKSTLLTGLEPDLMLRLPSLVASFALLIGFFVLVRRMVGGPAALAGVAMLAVEKRLIYRAVEVKPYELDAFLSLAVLGCFWHGLEDRWSKQSVAVLALIGSVGLWFSYPIVFVIAGGLIATFVIAAFQRDFPSCRRLLVVSTMTIGPSWIINYWLCIHGATNDPYLQNWWKDWMPPWPPSSPLDMLWFLDAFYRIFLSTIKTGLPILSAALALFGCIVLFKSHRALFWIVLSPLPLALIAAGLRLYPFGDRLLLYYIPQLFLLLGVALQWFWRSRKTTLRVLAAILLIACIAENTGQAITHFVYPKRVEDLPPVLKYVSDHQQSIDVIYILAGGAPAFQYYAPRFGLDRLSIYFGGPHTSEALEGDLVALTGNHRVWLLMAHGMWSCTAGDVEGLLLSIADRHGIRLSMFHAQGAAAYLYDFSPRGHFDH